MGPIVIQSEYAKVLTARYILFSIPFLIIFAASAFLNKNYLEMVSSYDLWAIIYLSVQSLVFNYQLLQIRHKPTYRGVKDLDIWRNGPRGKGFMKPLLISRKLSISKSKSKIVVGTEGYFGTLPDGLEAYLNNDKTITIVGVGLNFTNIPNP